MVHCFFTVEQHLSLATSARDHMLNRVFFSGVRTPSQTLVTFVVRVIVTVIAIEPLFRKAPTRSECLLTCAGEQTRIRV